MSLFQVYLQKTKKDGNKRMIPKLKKFNRFVKYDEYFEMESINNVINLIQPSNIYP